MLAYVKENPVTYVIVHKVDRLARNRVDDVEITLALQRCRGDARLLLREHRRDAERSAPARDHELDRRVLRRNLANEVIKGLIQKARSGGTPMRAPVGYLNVRKVEDGREIRDGRDRPRASAARCLGFQRPMRPASGRSGTCSMRSPRKAY